MAVVKHVLKRILMMLAGFFVSVLIGLIAVVVIYSALATLPIASASQNSKGSTRSVGTGLAISWETNRPRL